MLKIGLVLSKTPSYSETFFLSKIKGLQANGFEVTLYVQEKASDFKWCTVVAAPKVYKKNKFFQFTKAFQVVFKLLPYLKRLHKFITLEKEVNRSWKQILKNIYNNTHILTAHLDWLHFGFATMALQSEHVAEVIGAKMAVSLRGFDLDVYPLKHPDCYALLWKQVDKIHSISHYLIEKAYDLGLSEQTSYAIITPAVDVSKFKAVPKRTSKVIQFLTVGRLHWIKGISYSLEALALLKTQGIRFNYTVVGIGPDYESIVFAIHQLGLKDNVKLVGQTTHDETLDYFSKSDIYIQYSNSEGFCNAVLEAQVSGCLCVVSDGGALVENIVDGETGWVVPKRNPKALSKRIQDVIHLSEEEKKRIIDNAKKRVIKTFNLEKQQKEFVEFYY